MRWNLLSTTAMGALLVLSSAASAQQTGVAGRQDTGTVGRAQQLLDTSYQIPGQEVNPNLAVQDRPRPNYDPLGIRAGSFLLFPSIDTSVSYDDNVNATENRKKSATIINVNPQLDAQSNWSRHQLAASAYMDASKYLQQDENDYVDYGFGTKGRYDVSRAGAFRGSLAYDHLHEGKDSDDRISIGNSDVVEYNRYSAAGGYQHRFNRIALAGNLNYRVYDWDSFQAGPIEISQDYRNRQEYGGNARATYAISPRLSVFTQGDYLFYNYDNPSPGGSEQDSEKYGVRFGSGVDFTSIFFGEASLGYVTQNYKSNALDDESGLSADAALTWNVTTLSTLQLVGSRDFLPASTGGSSRLSTDVALVGHHELLRNVILNAQLRYENEDYKQTTLEKDIYSVGFGADYLITRNFRAGAEYLYTNQDSTARGGDYDKNVVMLRLKAQM